MALTSCHGQPVNSARARRAGFAASSLGSEKTVVLTAAMKQNSVPAAVRSGQERIAFKQIIRSGTLRCNSFATEAALRKTRYCVEKARNCSNLRDRGFAVPDPYVS